MRALIQRVSKAEVRVESDVVGKIGQGLLILLGVEEADGQEDVDWLCKKIAGMRIFQDEQDKMNLSVQDVSGEFLVVSQFTLHASTKKGNRPSFIKAARPDQANELYETFVKHMKDLTGLRVETGKFGAMMDVDLINDGPVTIWMDSKNKE